MPAFCSRMCVHTHVRTLTHTYTRTNLHFLHTHTHTHTHTCCISTRTTCRHVERRTQTLVTHTLALFAYSLTILTHSTHNTHTHMLTHPPLLVFTGPDTPRSSRKAQKESDDGEGLVSGFEHRNAKSVERKTIRRLMPTVSSVIANAFNTINLQV
jgi:hypothetical protein